MHNIIKYCINIIRIPYFNFLFLSRLFASRSYRKEIIGKCVKYDNNIGEIVIIIKSETERNDY